MSKASDAAMKHVRDYCAQVFQRRDERYRQRLSGWRKLVFDGLRMARPILRPLRRVQESWRLTKKYGAKVKDAEGISKWRQFIHQVALNLRTGVCPEDYYQFMLYQQEQREKAEAFIYHHQIDALLDPLAEEIAASDAEILRDKLLFWRFCKKHGHKTIPVLAVFEEGAMRRLGACQRDHLLPRENLFSKPVNLGQGKGVRCWEYVGEGMYASGEQISGEDLVRRLKDQARRIECRILLQPQIRNHQELEGLVGSTLAVARAVTIRRPYGDPEFLMAVMRLPVGKEATSNFSGGHLGVPIDGNTGTLGLARFKAPEKIMKPLKQHPRTERQIEGFKLPEWKRAVNLVKTAHDTLSKMPFVGWDVAFTDRGPVLIEGNHGFGSEVLQLTHKTPLGNTKLPVYHRQHVRA